MKRTLAVILMAITIFSLCACGKDTLVGKWSIKGHDGSEIIFYEDGTYELKYYTSTESMGTYTKIGSNKIELAEDEQTTEILTYTLDKTNHTIEVKVEN